MQNLGLVDSVDEGLEKKPRMVFVEHRGQLDNLVDRSGIFLEILGKSLDYLNRRGLQVAFCIRVVQDAASPFEIVRGEIVFLNRGLQQGEAIGELASGL